MYRPPLGQRAQQLTLIITLLTAAITTAGAETITNPADLPVLSKKGRAPVVSSTESTALKTGAPALYWYDGKRKRSLATDASTIADFGTADRRKAQPELRAAPTLGSKATQTGQADGTSPLFVDATSGRIAGALPGGVLVRMPAAVDIEMAAALAQRFDTQVQQPIGAPADTGSNRYELWLFSAEAGLPSLELANRIHESGAVDTASPNWWKPRSLK